MNYFLSVSENAAEIVKKMLGSAVIPCLLVIFGMVAKADKGKYLVCKRDFNGSTSQCSLSISKLSMLF